MTNTVSTDDRRKLIWAQVYQNLLQHAIPDSRFHYDFLASTPDFRGSAAAIDRLLALPCYQNARTLLVTSDNSLEQLRFRALKDGKKLLVATYRLRRGFVLLNPASIDVDRIAHAACLDGMEKSSVGRLISLAQLREEKLSIDMCAIGGLVFNQQGVTVWEGQALFEVQWAMLQDIQCLGTSVPVVAIAHACQVVNETELGLEAIKPSKPGEVQCDYVVTPDQTFQIANPMRPKETMDMASLDQEAVDNIPPLQELKGIRMMEKIMRDGGMGKPKEEEKKLDMPEEDEMRGIDIVKKLMKGYKP